MPMDLDDLEVVEPIALPPGLIQEQERYDPLAASVDHIVPRKAGGSDNPSNLRSPIFTATWRYSSSWPS
jgi:hypothetical protein